MITKLNRLENFRVLYQKTYLLPERVISSPRSFFNSIQEELDRIYPNLIFTSNIIMSKSSKINFSQNLILTLENPNEKCQDDPIVLYCIKSKFTPNSENDIFNMYPEFAKSNRISITLGFIEKDSDNTNKLMNSVRKCISRIISPPFFETKYPRITMELSLRPQSVLDKDKFILQFQSELSNKYTLILKEFRSGLGNRINNYNRNLIIFTNIEGKVIASQCKTYVLSEEFIQILKDNHSCFIPKAYFSIALKLRR